MVSPKVLLVLVIVSFVVAAPYSTSDAQQILTRHNVKRSIVNPPASPTMANLTWDATLANVASNYAETLKSSCSLYHSTSPYGENLAWRIPGGLLSIGLWAVDAWDDEKVDYNLASNTCAPNKVCGHYTQVVWANTLRVGCGYSNCTNGATIVVCNYDPPGNYVGQRPYTAGSGPAPPSPSRSPAPASASPSRSPAPASASPSRSRSPLANVSPSRSPVPSPSPSRSRSPVPPSPSRSPLPCNGGCSSPSSTCNTATNTCVCASGYTLVNNVCTVQNNGSPNWNSDFTVPSGPSTLTVVGNTLAISGTSSTPTLVKFSRPNAAVSISWTKTTTEVRQTTGSFGIGFRVGSNSGFADDGIYVFNNNIGLSSYNMGYNIKKNGAWLATTPSTQAFAQNRWSVNVPVTVSSWLTTNLTSGFTFVYLGTAYTETIGSTTYSYSATSGFGVHTASYFGSATGGVALYSKRTSAATTTCSKLTLATATTLSVSLSNCIDDTTWASMFRSLTGCPTCTVTVRAAGENGKCKDAGAKEAVSALTVVIESSTIASEAIATNFIAAVESGSAAVAPLAVKSVAIVPGIEGAVLAGLPEVVPVIAGAGAGAGGAAGGLSGGAIAGIVVGSVAGAVLIVGVTTIVVAAVIVAAVVVAKKASDSDAESAPSRADPEMNKRGSIRNTIYNIFRAPRGGVDVMNNPSGHQSITARSPQV